MDAVDFIRDYCRLDLRAFQVEWLEQLFSEQHGDRVYSQALWGVPRGDVIGKKQCEKLRQCIMSIDSANNVDELLALTIAS